MYDILVFIANVRKFFLIKSKICYWKIKYGKRLKIGKNVTFRRRLIINISKNGYLEIGNNNFFNNDCSINVHEKVVIGDNNDFGESVKIYDHSKVFNNKKIDMKHTYKSNPIYIGDNNWICSNVMILDKTRIKNYCVVGAAVVLNDICESGTIVQNKNNHIFNKIVYKKDGI